MYSVWIVTKLAARKGHTIKQKIGRATTGTRLKLCDAEGNDVCAGEGRWWFELEAAAAYLEPLPDVPEAERPALLPDDDAVLVDLRRPLLKPPPMPAKRFTIRDMAGRMGKG